MPQKVKKYCNYPGCYDIATDDSAYCTVHKHQICKSYELTRETAVVRGYDTRWRKIREMILKREPMCQCDLCKGYGKVADMVHHIDKNPKNNSLDNLLSMNAECHNSLHAEDRWKRRKLCNI